MRGYEPLIALAVAFLLIGTKECRAQSNDSTECLESTSNSQELESTSTPGIEKILKGFLKIVSPNDSKGSSITGFINSYIPNPIQSILDPIENITARGFGDILNLVEDHFHAIFPGTLWCGGGNIAKSEQDVGLFDKTDACCRAHDNCASNIAAGETKGPLLNNGIYTRSACSCDREFYSCLKNVSSVVSANIGATYFNILGPQCFACDYPIKSCSEYGRKRFGQMKCNEYDLDTSKNKELQWFDNPIF